MLTLEERYRPLNAGAKFLCLSKYRNNGRVSMHAVTREEAKYAHVKGIGIDIKLVAEPNYDYSIERTNTAGHVLSNRHNIIR